MRDGPFLRDSKTIRENLGSTRNAHRAPDAATVVETIGQRVRMLPGNSRDPMVTASGDVVAVYTLDTLLEEWRA